jgi:hypothetical protein
VDIMGWFWSIIAVAFVSIFGGLGLYDWRNRRRRGQGTSDSAVTWDNVAQDRVRDVRPYDGRYER